MGEVNSTAAACGKGSSPATHDSDKALQPRGAWDALLMGNAPQLPVGKLVCCEKSQVRKLKMGLPALHGNLGQTLGVAPQNGLS